METLTLAKARERAARHRAEVVDGGDPQARRKSKRAAARNDFTFDALAERYLAEYAKPNKSSWRNDEGYLKRPRAAWGAKAAAAVTRREVIDLLDEIRRTAPVSANRTQTVLITMFNWAVEGELLEGNPVARLKKRAKESPRERTLDDDELRILWDAVTTGEGMNLDSADALCLLLLTAQRPGEIAGLLQKEVVGIGTAEPRLELPSDRMKARKPHVVPLAPMARAIIERALNRRQEDGDGQSVFASKFSRRTTLARHSLSQGLKRTISRLEPTQDSRGAVQSLQADPPTPHTFRATVATGMARLGISGEDRRAVLAHPEGDTHSKHYDKYNRFAEKQRALERWEAHVGRLVREGASGDNIVPLRRGARS